MAYERNLAVKVVRNQKLAQRPVSDSQLRQPKSILGSSKQTVQQTYGSLLSSAVGKNVRVGRRGPRVGPIHGGRVQIVKPR